MRFVSITAALSALAVVMLCAPADAQETPREVNITQGSQEGWVPSEETEAAALEAWTKHYNLIDAGKYDAAYAMLSNRLQGMWSIEQFREDKASQRDEIGVAVTRKPLKITWTKGGAAAPDGNTYAAIDTNAAFERAQRFCGYTIMVKRPGAARFEVARVEENLLSDASAEQLGRNNPPLTADLIWNLLARSCPNYLPPALPDSVNQGTGYSSVSAARAEVDAIANTETSIENGWTLIADKASLTVWSFAPENSPYYPALIKRVISATGETSSQMAMTMLCEAEKPRCDALYAEMAARNGMLPISNE